MNQRSRVAVYMGLVLVLTSCGHGGGSSRNSKFCVAARRVEAELKNFSANKSPVFDNATRTQAEKLVTSASAALKLANSNEMRTALKDVRGSVQTLIDNANAKSPKQLQALRSASAKYVESNSEYMSLLSSKCS